MIHSLLLFVVNVQYVSAPIKYAYCLLSTNLLSLSDSLTLGKSIFYEIFFLQIEDFLSLISFLGNCSRGSQLHEDHKSNLFVWSWRVVLLLKVFRISFSICTRGVVLAVVQLVIKVQQFSLPLTNNFGMLLGLFGASSFRGLWSASSISFINPIVLFSLFQAI